MKFKTGQTAWCLIHGRCVITQTEPALIARTTAKVTTDVYYTPDGRLSANTNQVLFHYPMQPVAFLKRDSLVCEKSLVKSTMLINCYPMEQ